LIKDDPSELTTHKANIEEDEKHHKQNLLSEKGLFCMVFAEVS